MTATPTTPTTPSDQSWISRYGWLLAAVWLVFLVFPLLEILTGDDVGTGTKIISAALFLVFAAVYLDGFRRQHRRAQQAAFEPQPTSSHWTGRDTAGVGHFVGLMVLAVVLLAVSGLGSVGVLAFVVVFAVFHFSWRVAVASFAAGVATALALPLLAGRLADLWFLSIIVAGVGAAAMLIRGFEGHQYDQAHLRTGLAVSDERTRVARDVHDVLGHSLTVIILKVELCQRLLDGSGPDGTADEERTEACRKQLAELGSISRQALTEIRSTVGGLRATDVADEVTAARTVLADADVKLLVTGDLSDLDAVHRPMLAWVVREAVTNIVRHARAEHCRIELAPAEEAVLLRITDDGVGLGASDEGNGLRGLRERVTAAGGSLRVRSPVPVSADGGQTDGSTACFGSGTMIEVTS